MTFRGKYNGVFTTCLKLQEMSLMSEHIQRI